MNEFNTTSCPLNVYGVPCNQFGLQEPGVGVEILNSLKYVRPGNGFEPYFDLLKKRDVNGKKEDELFTWLKVKYSITQYRQQRSLYCNNNYRTCGFSNLYNFSQMCICDFHSSLKPRLHGRFMLRF